MARPLHSSRTFRVRKKDVLETVPSMNISFSYPFSENETVSANLLCPVYGLPVNFRGRPRRRSVVSRLSRFTVRPVHRSSPNGPGGTGLASVLFLRSLHPRTGNNASARVDTPLAQPVGVPAVVAPERVDHPVHPPGVVVVKRPRPQRARLARGPAVRSPALRRNLCS